MTISSPTDLALDFWWNGCLILRGAVPDELVDVVRRETDELYEDESNRRARRVQDAWEVKPGTRAIAITTEILDTLQHLYQRRPIPYQTLNFLHGTQQRAHADSMHASTLPVGYVCTAWTALDETNSDNGALFYYPGSHHLPEVTPQDLTASLTEFNYREYEDHQQSLMQTLGYERREFHARPGDVMLFAGNIVHGGCPVADRDKTRRSVVTQYVFEDCIYYTPRRSDLSAGALALRDPLIDICTGRRVKQTFNGRPVASYRLKSGLRRVQLDATLAQRALALVRDARYGFPQQKNRILRGRERKLRQATGKTVRLG